MCGFIGELLHHANNHTSEERWSESLEAIHHRGPDSTGNYQDSFVRLGFKRLSIIDIEHGHQPLSYENGRYQIIFNGEIYNYVELKAELTERGYLFETDSDTEVLLALYAFEGKESVKKLRGMFAFAIWDTEKGELFCARDPFGIKPFYYVKDEERFFFASELKSINPILDEQAIVHESLQHYTTFQFVPEPRALTKNVHKLLPGHTLTITNQLDETIEPYSTRSFKPKTGINSSQLAKMTKALLRDSVAKHMRSDVPVGAFLSSGIDSTSIVALAKERHPNLKTFTVGFGNEGFSEIDIAKDTAAKLGVENISKVITPEEFIQELPNIIWHMDEPVADPAAVPLYFVAKEASKHVKVVLSGEGADELFGGYNIYREPIDLAWFKRIPMGLHKPLNGLFHQLPGAVKGRNYFIRGTTPIETRYIGNAFIFSEAEKAQLFKQYDPTMPYTNITKPLYQDIATYDESTKMQYIDMHTWLPGDILVKADRMTMAHSIELRVPFLDKDVFAFARTIERDAKLKNKTTKYVLREAMKEYIPSTIVPRKKLGFPVPIRHWLKNEMYDWTKTLIKKSETASTYFHTDFLLNLLEDHAAGKADNSRKLWTIICFILWHQVHVEKSVTSPNQIVNMMRVTKEEREEVDAL